MSDRNTIIEARMLLLARAMRSEFHGTPVGEFEAHWDAVDPSTPFPPRREVKAPGCDCERCMASYERDLATGKVERPLLP